MFRFILVSFLFLGVAFFQMSGGSSFDPEAARMAAMEARAERKGVAFDPNLVPDEPDAASQTVASAEAEELPVEPSPKENEVSRVSLNLTTLREVLDDEDTPRPPILPADELTPNHGTGDTMDTAVDAALAEALVDEPTGEETARIILPSLIFEGESYESFPEGADDGALRRVTGTLVNVRGGPGTDYEVVGQLSEGASVEVLQDSGTGWIQMRPLDGGQVGWMADFLLGDG